MITYKNVFNRENFKEITSDKFFTDPESILKGFGIEQPKELAKMIKNTADKVLRNDLKRELLPAANISTAGLLSIDIDGISTDFYLIKKITEKLISDGRALAVQESVSGNLVAYFKFDCSVADYPYLYYKLWLEFTLLLGVSIDFLPDLQRLRYISLGDLYHYDDGAPVITEILKIERLPSINTNITVRDARGIIYRSV